MAEIPISLQLVFGDVRKYLVDVARLNLLVGWISLVAGAITPTLDGGAGDWIGERLYQTIREAWGQEPLALHSRQDAGVLVVAGPGPVGAAGLIRSLTAWR